MCGARSIIVLTCCAVWVNAWEFAISAPCLQTDLLVNRAVVARRASPRARLQYLDHTTLGKPAASALNGAGPQYHSGILYKSTVIPSMQAAQASFSALPEQRRNGGVALRGSLDVPRAHPAGATVKARAGLADTVLQASETEVGAPGPELVLYGSQGSRSPLVNWAMHELGLEFSMGDLSQNPHPFGQIPSLKAGDAELFESGAILVYLQNMFGIETSEKIKAAIISWIVWANASLDPVCFLETPEGKVYDTGLKNPKQRRIVKLDGIFSKQRFIVSDDFTLADVAIASYLLYVPQFFPDVKLSQWPNLVAYMKRCAERPAYGKAFGSKVQGFLLQKLAKEAEGGADKNPFDWLGR